MSETQQQSIDLLQGACCAHVFGLTEVGALLGKCGVIASNVTSACIRHDCGQLLGDGADTGNAAAAACLLYSTRDNQMVAVSLQQPSSSAPAEELHAWASDSIKAERDATCAVAVAASTSMLSRPQLLQLIGSAGTRRAVEAGASLMACLPGGQMVVMQMPRGNLEGAHVKLGAWCAMQTTRRVSRIILFAHQCRARHNFELG